MCRWIPLTSARHGVWAHPPSPLCVLAAQVPDGTTVSALRAAINAQLGVPLDMHLSKQAALLTSKEPYSFRDLAIPVSDHA